MSSCVSLKNLQRQFGGVTVINGITAEVQYGHFW